MRRIIAGLSVVLGFFASASFATADNRVVSVLYAGSLVNLMERSVGPAFEKDTGLRFSGYAAGSNKLANEVKGRLRRGDVFISADPKVNESLTGAANGDWVRWYINFAESPLLLGYNPRSHFADDLKSKRWDQVLQEKGIRIGRTDPKLDPKGVLTVELVTRAAEAYMEPDLVARTLGSADNPEQIFPEETLVGRLQSGQLDVGFFYSTETVTLKIPSIKLPPELAPKARYTIAVLNNSQNMQGANRFVSFLLGPQGTPLLTEHGIDVIHPTLSGDKHAVPLAIQTAIDAIQ
ncbi:MAG TPA: extracellular solute-binding protein [Steroidobacteraceae bacterium]